MSALPELIERPSFLVRDSPISPPTTPDSSEFGANEPTEYVDCRDALEKHVPIESLSEPEALSWMENFQNLWVRGLSGLS